MVDTKSSGRGFPGWEDIPANLTPSVTNNYTLGTSSKQWAAIWVAIALVTSLTIGGVIGLSNVNSILYINASTQVNGSLFVDENITAINITASGLYFGNGSQLTGISAGAETDPKWTANYSAFLTHITWATAMNGTLFKTSQWNATNISYLEIKNWNATNTSYIGWSNGYNNSVWGWVMNGTIFKTSQWNATNTSYLPLAGGTMTGNLNFSANINITFNGNGNLIRSNITCLQLKGSTVTMLIC